MTFLLSASVGRRTAGVVVALVLLTSAVGCGSSTPEARPSDEQSHQPTATPQGADQTEPGACDGVIGAKPVTHVRVPEGATCRLDGTRVDGNVSVGHGATLVARGITVDGDVEAEGARSVEVSHDSRVGGNLQVQRGDSVQVTDSTVDGDLEWEELGGRLVARDTKVGGNLEADRNPGHVTIAGNTVEGDLSCEENRAIDGGHNKVRGEREGQCARL